MFSFSTWLQQRRSKRIRECRMHLMLLRAELAQVVKTEDEYVAKIRHGNVLTSIELSLYELCGATRAELFAQICVCKESLARVDVDRPKVVYTRPHPVRAA